MIALDTNVLVRYLREDDESQAARAAALIDAAAQRHEPLFVSHVVLCELTWVLQSGYRVPKAEIVTTLRGLFSASQLVIEDIDAGRRALARFQTGRAGFADYLIAERAQDHGCTRVATFDKVLLDDSDFFAP